MPSAAHDPASSPLRHAASAGPDGSRAAAIGAGLAARGGEEVHLGAAVRAPREQAGGEDLCRRMGKAAEHPARGVASGHRGQCSAGRIGRAATIAASASRISASRAATRARDMTSCARRTNSA